MSKHIKHMKLVIAEHDKKMVESVEKLHYFIMFITICNTIYYSSHLLLVNDTNPLFNYYVDNYIKSIIFQVAVCILLMWSINEQ